MTGLNVRSRCSKFRPAPVRYRRGYRHSRQSRTCGSPMLQRRAEARAPCHPRKSWDWEALTRLIAVGSDPSLDKGGESSDSADQCIFRTRSQFANVSERLRQVALHCTRRCFLRMARNQRGTKETAICSRDEGRMSVRARGHWQGPQTREGVRTFAIIMEANDLLAPIHDRMPLILAPSDCDRWLSAHEPDLDNLRKPYPAAPMVVWPISTRVNSPENDDVSIMEMDEAVAQNARMVVEPRL